MSDQPQQIDSDGLKARYEKRKFCWEAVKGSMKLAITGDRRKGVGSAKRKLFISGIGSMLQQFPTEDEEYKYIKKFGRGIWEDSIIKSFNEEEQALIVDVIAHEFGAFDY